MDADLNDISFKSVSGPLSNVHSTSTPLPSHFPYLIDELKKKTEIRAPRQLDSGNGVTEEE